MITTIFKTYFLFIFVSLHTMCMQVPTEARVSVPLEAKLEMVVSYH